MESVMESTSYIMKQDLVEKGWTKTLIAKFAGNPDKFKRHSGYKNPLCLYDSDRISLIESMDEFREALELSVLRRKKVQETKKINKEKAWSEKQSFLESKIKTIIDDYSNIAIDVKSIPVEDIEVAALQSYNHWVNDKIDYFLRKHDSRWEEFFEETVCTNRMAVNFIRHRLTNYEDEIDALRRLSNSFDGFAIPFPEHRQCYKLLKTATIRAIAEKYPKFATECCRQIAIMEEE